MFNKYLCYVIRYVAVLQHKLLNNTERLSYNDNIFIVKNIILFFFVKKSQIFQFMPEFRLAQDTPKVKVDAIQSQFLKIWVYIADNTKK